VRSFRYGTPEWTRYLSARRAPAASSLAVERGVARIVEDVRRHGDAALVRLTARFDGVRLAPGTLRVPAREVRRLAAQAPLSLRRALREMAARVRAFHARQRDPGFTLRLGPGARLSEVVAPIDSAALYVPGGAGAYPSSVLMGAIPALLAGVPRLQVMSVYGHVACAMCSFAVVHAGGAQYDKDDSTSASVLEQVWGKFMCS